MITDLGHIALAAHDLEQSLAFYAQLDIHEAFRLNHPDGRIMLIYLHVAGDRFIELFPGGVPPDPEREGSFRHLCLLTDSLHDTVEQLRQAGVVIEKEPTLGLDHNWQAWIRDPDGNAIELMQLTEESPQRQTARGG
jgi:lactoylglutathione lyase